MQYKTLTVTDYINAGFQEEGHTFQVGRGETRDSPIQS